MRFFSFNNAKGVNSVAHILLDSHVNLVNMTLLASSLPVTQWLERPTGVRKVMGSILVGEQDLFFVPRSRQAEYYIVFISLRP